jgi:hypothetical protein
MVGYYRRGDWMDTCNSLEKHQLRAGIYNQEPPFDFGCTAASFAWILPETNRCSLTS